VWGGGGVGVVGGGVGWGGGGGLGERFVGTVRRECLDPMLVFHRAHPETVLGEFIDHYNEHRPHRSLGQRAPLAMAKTKPRISEPDPAQLRRSDKLGGLVDEYRLVA